MTDNTEAVEKLAEVISDIRGAGPTLTLDHIAAQAILAAIQADPLAYVKPKPLEWADRSNGSLVVTAIGRVYFIEVDDDGVYALWIKKFGGSWEFTFHPTLEAAQAAAEAHRDEMLAKEFV